MGKRTPFKRFGSTPEEQMKKSQFSSINNNGKFIAYPEILSESGYGSNDDNSNLKTFIKQETMVLYQLLETH